MIQAQAKSMYELFDERFREEAEPWERPCPKFQESMRSRFHQSTRHCKEAAKPKA